MKQQYYLVDALLKILEDNNDNFGREFVQRVRVLIKIPECAELFNCVVINALGLHVNIKESIVDRGVDCLIGLHEHDIDNDASLAEEQRNLCKIQMKSQMCLYKDLIKKSLGAQLVHD